jgi:hypothetical protein
VTQASPVSPAALIDVWHFFEAVKPRIIQGRLGQIA